MKIRHPACMLILAASCASAFASEDSSKSELQWKLLGPAFSYHQTMDGAPIVRPRHMTMKSTAPTSNATGSIEMVLHPEERAWSGTNPAFGIEVSRRPGAPGSGTRDLLFISAVRDSYGSQSVMGGVGRAWEIGNLGSMKFEAGATAGLWRRSVSEGDFKTGSIYAGCSAPSGCDVYETRLKRAWVPFVLPFLAVTEQHTGIGMNLGLAPKIRIGGNDVVPTNTVMLQLTYAVAFF